MTTELSVIIPVLNDEVDLKVTVSGLLNSTPADRVEIIVVDDFSDTPVADLPDSVKLIRLPERRGVAFARHLGAMLATGKWLLMIDSHMQFGKNWYELMMPRIRSEPDYRVAFNGTCLGLGFGAKTLEEYKGRYCAATICLWNEKELDLIEGKWLPTSPIDDAEVPCFMGACYVFTRIWFLELGGLSALRMWGSDEPYLGLKCWMYGGSIRFMSRVEFGHKFRDSAPYVTQVWNIVYNKARIAAELFDAEDRDVAFALLARKYPDEWRYVLQQLSEDASLISQARSRPKVRDLDWYCQRFNIQPLPDGSEIS